MALAQRRRAGLNAGNSMGRFIQISIALVLAYAWRWTTVLKERGVVDDRQRLWILCAVGVLFVAQQIAQTRRKPGDRSAVEARRRVMETYLDAFLIAYYELLERRGRHCCRP